MSDQALGTTIITQVGVIVADIETKAKMWADVLGMPVPEIIVTDTVDGMPDPCPIVRDLDSGIYLKGDGGKFVLGGFEANPKPWIPHPRDAGFLMFDEDWDHARPMLDAGINRAPVIAQQGITHFMNGPESFTPDTRQIMGEAPGCRNLFVAAGFNSIGIMSSAGVGKVMAEWVRDNEAPLDLWEVDIARL
ncbi:MAG: FAD-binding oxidoreductase, partial [bacterium]|nr:FAD-binding oxidoreductase [bacterium]